ncbi:hypothetical protein GCM10027610_131080 [Dactylosporangium cerinum]
MEPTWNPSSGGTANAAPPTAGRGSPDGRYTTVGSEDVPCCARTAASDRPGTAEDRAATDAAGNDAASSMSTATDAVWNVPTSSTANPTAARTGAAIDASRRAATEAAPRTSTPVAPRPAGTRRASGTTRTGASSAAATSSTIADMRTIVGLSFALDPGRSSASPPPARTQRMPVTHRVRVIGRRSTAASRSASSGGTRPARRADSHTPVAATTRPTSTDTSTAHQDRPTVNPVGSRPTFTSGSASSGVARAPRKAPGTPANSATRRVSVSSSRRTWPGVAPTARSRPSSRRRDVTANAQVEDTTNTATNPPTKTVAMMSCAPSHRVRVSCSGSTADRASPVSTDPSGPTSRRDSAARSPSTPITRTPPANEEAVASST